MHATALTDYVRASKIRQGLRIQKAPGIFQEDEEFKIKWASILNQCSRDLMLLIIDKSKQEVAKIKEETLKMQTVFQSQYDQEGFDKKMQEMEISLKEFQHKTKDIKIRKYHRDNKDYSLNRVFVWMHEPKKKVTWAEPIEKYSDQETSDVDSSELSGDEGPSTLSLRSQTLHNRQERGRSESFFRVRGRRGRKKQ